MATEDDPRAGAELVARVLKEAGHEAYFAGGSVRDLLLGLRPKDYDIVTDARPERIAELFRRTQMIGAAFGVVQVRLKGHAYEVATFRSDGTYVDGRRPESVTYADSLEEDVARRDFTINALLMDPESGRVIDVVGGRPDLDAGLVRAVGTPERRFAEDRLRMLRAVRFAARFGFALEPETQAAIERHAPEVRDVSVERIMIELDGILLGAQPERGLDLLQVTGLAGPAMPFLPQSERHRQAILQRLADHETWRRLPTDERLTCAWAVLLGEEDDAERALRPMRASRERMRACQRLLDRRQLLEAPGGESDFLKMAADEPVPQLDAYAEAIGAQAGRQALSAAVEALERAPLPPRPLLTGSDLQALGLQPGPDFKRWLSEVDELVLARRLKTREEAMDYVRAQLD